MTEETDDSTSNQDSVCLKFLIIFGKMFNDLFHIHIGHSRMQAAKSSPHFSGMIIIFSSLFTGLLFAMISFKYQRGIYNLCKTLGRGDGSTEEIENGECLMRKIELFTFSSYSLMSICLSTIFVRRISSNARQS